MDNMKPLTMEELASLRALCDKATTGERTFRQVRDHCDEYDAFLMPLDLHIPDSISEGDCEFLKQIDPDTVRRLIAAAERSIELEKRVEEYGKVMIHVVPGEHGEGEEVPATPESIRGLLKELQREWDNAERRIAELEKRSCRRPIADSPRDGTLIDIFSKEGVRFANVKYDAPCRGPKGVGK